MRGGEGKKMRTEDELKRELEFLDRQHFRAVQDYFEYDSRFFKRVSKLKELDQLITRYYAKACAIRWALGANL